MVDRTLIAISILSFVCTIAFAQTYYFGDPFTYFTTDGINGTLNQDRIILLNGIWQQVKPIENTIRVPFCYDGQEPLKIRKSFQIPPNFRNSQFRLVCYGIGHTATIRLNHEFLAMINGTEKLWIDIPKNQIFIGPENVLEIELKPESENPLDYPLAATFYTPKRYSGIYRDIYLLALPEKRIESFSIKAHWEERSGKIHIKYLIRDTKLTFSNTNLPSAESNLRLWVNIFSQKMEPLFTTNIPINFQSGSIQSGAIEQMMNGAREWTPSQPHLYTLRMILYNADTVCHKVEAVFGFKNRKIVPGGVATASGIFQIRAANYVEEFPESGWAVTPTQLENDVANAKLLGLNTLRVIGKTPHPYLYSLADKYGLWLLVEPAVFLPPASILKDNGFKQHIVATMRELLIDNEHHPSLLAMGIGYGIPIDENETALSELYRQLKIELQVPLYLSAPKQDENIPYDLFLLEQLPKHFIQYPSQGLSSTPFLYSSLGMLVDPITIQGSSPEAEMRQTQMTIHFLQLPQVKNSSGFILAALNDYRTMYPLLFRTPSPQPFLVTSGIWNFQRNARAIFTPLRDYLDGLNVRTIPIQDNPKEPPPHFLVTLLFILAITAMVFGRIKLIRNHFYRSFMNTLRFWEDIREGRFFQYGESLIILLLVAAVMAVIVSATVQGLKQNLAFDVLLTALLQGYPFLKVYVNRLIWEPTLLILFFFVVFVTMSFLISGISAFLSLFSKQRMSFQKTMSYFAWSFANHLFLLPIALFLISSIAVEPISIGWLLFGLVMLVWSIFRLATAILVAYHNSSKTAVILFFVLIGVMFVILYYWVWDSKNIGLYWSSFIVAGW